MHRKNPVYSVLLQHATSSQTLDSNVKRRMTCNERHSNDECSIQSASHNQMRSREAIDQNFQEGRLLIRRFLIRASGIAPSWPERPSQSPLKANCRRLASRLCSVLHGCYTGCYTSYIS